MTSFYFRNLDTISKREDSENSASDIIESDSISNASKAVTLRYNEAKGRHLMVRI